MNNCLDTGTIQAFLDGELTPSAASRVSAHIAACDACASSLATAEEESALVFSVLEREMETLVPTQRLWNKINESIEVDKHNAPLLIKTWNGLIASLMNPSLAVTAAILVVIGLFSVVFVEMNKPTEVPEVALRDPQTPRPVQTTNVDTSAIVDPDSGNKYSQPVVTKATDEVPAKVIRTVYRPTTDQAPVKPSPVTPGQAAYIPGEESYVKTIASLSQTVNNQKDTVLRPSELVSYERDMAVVDDAINKMRQEVQKNPKNESAKQVLYTSYQNKIDLLNSVSQREELVASLR